MRLSELARALPERPTWPAGDPDIRDVCSDSRRVTPGCLFVAVPGDTLDGHSFIPQAVRAGAAAVVGEQPDARAGLPYLRVANARRALGQLAAAWHGYPSRRMTLVGVTGTDGKTTTINLLYEILRAAGISVGMISTVSARIGGEELDTGFHVTTPDAPQVQALLAQMASAGLTHALIEVTSHGLAQERVAGCEFDVAVITNITHEHLDYHGSYEAYREAKGRLFSELGGTSPKPFNPRRLAVLNHDDSSFEYLHSIASVPVLSYGSESAADVRAERVVYSPHGIAFDLAYEGKTRPVRSPLVGAFNVANILAALAAGLGGLGVEAETAIAAIESTPGVAGRMERIDLGQSFTAIVDFAHTPNALQRALAAARTLTRGRVIVVFGAAGLRDRAKRRMMAEAAIELADLSVLTAEDPRTESLAAILDEMAAGALARGGVEGRSFLRVPDRGQALREAVQRAQPGDLVMACGKGHEQSMCFGETEYPWDDRTAMRSALAELLHVPGPAMPRLPTGIA
jgi:UDP-N-acetylmuramoyl-L-alanyl-D-glutamate--2,6-diaminopimelate ligase